METTNLDQSISAESYAERTLEVMDLVGDKWTLLVTYRLGEQSLRFAELKRAARPISSKMLSQTLRALERFDMVRRSVLDTSPPGVEYALTDLGRSFLAAASVVCAWTRDNAQALEDARTRSEELLDTKLPG